MWWVRSFKSWIISLWIHWTSFIFSSFHILTCGTSKQNYVNSLFRDHDQLATCYGNCSLLEYLSPKFMIKYICVHEKISLAAVLRRVNLYHIQNSWLYVFTAVSLVAFWIFKEASSEMLSTSPAAASIYITRVMPD